MPTANYLLSDLFVKIFLFITLLLLVKLWNKGKGIYFFSILFNKIERHIECHSYILYYLLFHHGMKLPEIIDNVRIALHKKRKKAFKYNEIHRR